LEPRLLEGAFGGPILGLNDGRAWEQLQLSPLLSRNVPRPHVLLFGLDWVWCSPDADMVRVSPSREFQRGSMTRIPGTTGRRRLSMMPARPRTTFGAAGDDRSCR
jgi:hypothetical protein